LKILTKRIILRPLIEEDMALVYELFSNSEISRLTGKEPLTEIIKAHGLLKELNSRFLSMAVCLNSGELIGLCGIRYLSHLNEYDLSYRFLKKYWNKGMATESVWAALEYSFDTLGLQQIVANVMPENLASIKVLQKLNFSFRGIDRNVCSPRPFIKYVLTSQDYRNVILGSAKKS